MSRISAFPNQEVVRPGPALIQPPLALDSLNSVAELLHPYFTGQTHEHLRALYLDRRGSLCGMGAWSGERDQVDLPIRRILATALAADAAALILAHNHPSGDPHPSPRDVRTSRILARVCAAVDIRLIDHVIIADGKITSMRALRLI